ncbi:MAG: hypothetical protein JST12_16150 [Armatimonadetes bacterium]|nr:hypothetical protein [Armatimonadota bacterium]
MLSTLLTGVLVLQAKTAMTSPEVVSVSMFKNGYAFITRRIPVKDGIANIVEVPQASLGTLWFWTPDGEIQSISTATDVDKTSKTESLKNFDELVQKNVGKTVSIESNVTPPLEGKIKSADGGLLVLETANGTIALPKDAIRFVRTSEPGFTWTKTVELTSENKYYKISADKKTKEVMMMSLERGITWAPGYAVDITNPDKLTLASKATVLNDLTDLDKVPTRLITGFPNLQFKDILDPLTANMPGDQWLSSLGVASQPVSRGGGQGGFMTQNAYRPMADKEVQWGGTPASEAGGEQISDLFFYDLSNFVSKKGSRTYQNLFRFDAEYKHVYTWDIDDQVDASGNYKIMPPNAPDSEDVWHTIKFKNGAGKPLTTAPATIFNKGELIGQSMMSYCMADGECDLQINKALDVQAESNEEEVERERGAIKDRYNNPKYDLVTVKGTLQVRNGRKDEIQMRITKNLTGEVISKTGDPTVTKTTRGLRQVNTTSKLVWKPSVKKGEKLTLEYTYKLYVPAT